MDLEAKPLRLQQPLPASIQYDDGGESRLAIRQSTPVDVNKKPKTNAGTQKRPAAAETQAPKRPAAGDGFTAAENHVPAATEGETDVFIAQMPLPKPAAAPSANKRLGVKPEGVHIQGAQFPDLKGESLGCGKCRQNKNVRCHKCRTLLGLVWSSSESLYKWE